jgi:hypothetical protein
MTHADAGRQRRGQAQRLLSMRGPTGTLGLRRGLGFLVSGQRGPQEALGALGQFPDHVGGGHYLCHRPC